MICGRTHQDTTHLTPQLTDSIIADVTGSDGIDQGGPSIMSNPFMEPRITSLEISMADLKEIVAETSRQIAENSREIREMQEKSDREFAKFQKEMKEFKDEMKEYKEDSRLWREKKDREFEEMKEERRQHNLEIGRIANKQGRMAEDLVAPSICRIMKEALGIEDKIPCVDYVRVKRTYKGHRSRVREFDVIAECLDYVLVNETKSSLKPDDVDRLIDTIGEIQDYFPEFRDRKLVGALASLSVDISVVNYASEKGILTLAVGDELMDIKNRIGFKPAVWGP